MDQINRAKTLLNELEIFIRSIDQMYGQNVQNRIFVSLDGEKPANTILFRFQATSISRE